jgi:hypothetical protein
MSKESRASKREANRADRAAKKVLADHAATWRHRERTNPAPSRDDNPPVAHIGGPYAGTTFYAAWFRP